MRAEQDPDRLQKGVLAGSLGSHALHLTTGKPYEATAQRPVSPSACAGCPWPAATCVWWLRQANHQAHTSVLSSTANPDIVYLLLVAS
jgi:hypothetical protein